MHFGFFAYSNHLLNQFYYILISGLTFDGLIYCFICITITLLLYFLSKRFFTFRIPLIIISFLFSTIYVYWRTKYTLSLDTIPNIIASLFLLCAEYLGYIQQGIFYLLMSHGTDVEKITLNQKENSPTVDVFVATYNEPISVLRRTLTACTYLDYPSQLLKIYVCDDGDRVEVEQLASELSIVYLRRNEHTHAKAGNLNNAMKQSNGDLILTLDADMVPKSDFLQKTIGYFQKRRVAFVQAPQLFFNPDPFQHNLSSTTQVANEQDFFMIEMESAKSHFNATMYVGSNCIFSRTALNSIGGFATGCITEDVATGMLLQAKGYKTFFVKDVLARGLAPESFSEMLHQRERWCRGNLQAFRIWNPIIYSGLSIIQRLLYLSGALYWYFGIQKMIYILAPILFLDFGIHTLNASVFSIMLFWLPQFYSSMLSFRCIAKGRRTTFWSHIYETAMAPSLANSALQETFYLKKLGFRVTKKGLTNQSIQIVWSTFLSHTILLIATIIGLLLPIIRGQSISPLYWINDFWTLYNLIGIIMSIYVSIELPRPRRSERFKIKIPIKLHTNDYVYKGMSIDISEKGARVELYERLTGISSKLSLSIKGVDELIPVQQVQALISDKFEVRLIWDSLPFQQYRQIIKLLYDQPENIMNQFRNHRTSGTLFTLLRSTKAHYKIFAHNKKQKRTNYKDGESIKF